MAAGTAYQCFLCARATQRGLHIGSWGLQGSPEHALTPLGEVSEPLSHRVVKWLAWAPAALAGRDQTCTQALGFQGSCSNHDATLPVASLWVQGVGGSHLRAPVTFLQELSWSSEVTPASPPRPCTSLLPRRPPHDLMQTAVDMAFPSPFWSRSPYPMPASPCCLGQSWHRAATACPPLPSRASLGFQLTELFETCPGS